MYFKQIDEIVTGRKACTQRCEQPGKTCHRRGDVITQVFTTQRRVKWWVGGVYAVSPGRGQRCVLVRREGDAYWLTTPNGEATQAEFLEHGFVPLRIRVTQIEHVRVQSTDERVAVTEGVQSVAEYAALWRSINAIKGTR